MNKPVAYWDGKHYASKDKSSLADIPLYTQDQLEEARKLGMQQERALWNLSESTQEFESFDRTASHMAGEYVAHPVKEHFEDEPQAEELHEILQSNSHPAELTQGEIHAVWASGSYYTLDKEGNVDEIRFEDFARAILRKTQESDKIESLGTVNIGGVHFRNGKEVK